jgi:hypothetical protein
MARLVPRWDAAGPEVEAAFRSVSAVLAGTDFYLAGGTALALQLGHRLSVDLDLFSPTFANPEELAAGLVVASPQITVTATAPRTVELVIEGVPATVFGYPYPLLEPTVEAEPGLLPLASPDDIAAMKLAAIASRGSRKDFVDLWVITQCCRTLGECLELYSRKFSTRDIGHLLRSLVYFDDADREPPLRMLMPIDWDLAKRELTEAVVKIVSS